MRQSIQRRKFRRFLPPLVSILVLSVAFTTGLRVLPTFSLFRDYGTKQQYFAESESNLVLQKATPEKKQISLNPSVLAETTGTGNCGQAWTWPCDDSKKRGYLVNGKKLDEAGNTIYFENVLLKKQPHGLEIGGGVSTSTTVVVDAGDPNDPRDDVKKKIGFCLTDGVQYESLAIIALSQPLLPKTIQGLGLSIKPINDKGDQFAGIDLKWLSTLKPEQFEKLFCSLAGDYSEYTLRSMDIYGIIPSSNQLGMDWTSFINMKCNGRRPGESSAEFAKIWEQDEDRDTTTFKVLVENNEFHNEVDVHFQPKMLKDGLSGIIAPGVGYIGGLAFQPKSQDTYLAKLAGSAITSQSLAGAINAAPRKTAKDLIENATGIDQKSPDSYSSTMLSVGAEMLEDKEDPETKKILPGGAYQDEYEKATVESAIFGGIYYIPDSEVEKGGNPSMLSYDTNKLDPSKYLCDEQSGYNSCPIIRATSGCSGLFQAKVAIRLRQIILSAVNDTDSYAGTTGDQGSNDEVARSYTRSGDFFEGAFRKPEPYIEKATTDELIVLTGKGTPKCMEYATARVEAQGSTKLTEKDKDRIRNAAESPNYTKQAFLVSPINVKYRTWANYKRDLGILAQWGITKAIFGPDPEWASDEVSGEKIKPALISFKADTLYRGQGGTVVGDPYSLEVQKNINAFLKKNKIEVMSDAHIDCATGPYGTAEYWLCSDSANILPKCQ